MAPKRPAAAAAASGSASDAEADAHHHHSDPEDPSKTPPPPNPNPKSSSAAATAPSAAPADSAAARSDSAGSYDDSDADARRRTKPAASPPPKTTSKPRPRSPGINSDSDDSHVAAGFGTDLDPAADSRFSDSDSDSDANHNTTSPPRRHARAEAAIVKPISSRPMDPPPRRASSPRAKRPRSAAIPAPPPSAAEHLKRPARLWSPDDELVILRGLATYRAKSGVLPGSTNDIGKLHSHVRAQLSVKVSTTQLSDKVRRLKQKYQLLAIRARNGRDQELHTPHDRSIYDHAKKVWGTASSTAGGDGGSGYDNNAADGYSEELPDSGGDSDDDDMDSGRDDSRYRIKNRKLRPLPMANGNGPRRAAYTATNGRGKTELDKGKDAYPYLWETVEELAKEHPSGAAFKKAFEVLEGSRAQVMEEKLRRFRMTEIKQQLRRMDLMKDTVRMVLDALERAD